MIRTVNLISGSGSTNAEILKAQKPGGVLHGLVSTVAVVSSDPAASGIKRARNTGFPESRIHIVDSNDKLTAQLLMILGRYKSDYFHQLGWMPKTPVEVIQKYKGLNQHLGPGGKWMYGVRRIYALIRFMSLTGRNLLLPIFCQWVAPEYDAGNIIYARWVRIAVDETAERVARRVLPIEHEVQIEALRRLAVGNIQERPVPRFFRTKREEALLLQAKKEAREKYHPGQ